jgi:demethylspheroidene O-methyltransferase
MPTAWGDALGAWRNRLLSRAATRDRFLSFWPTRWIARREAARLFDLVGGFVYSQVLYCVISLGWVERLSLGPCTTESLAESAAMPEPALRRLLDAAQALELTELRSDGRWQLGPLGAALQDNAAVQAMVLHHATLYADLANPLGLLRSTDSPTQLARFWDYSQASRELNPAAEGSAETSPSQTSCAMDYSRLMAASQPLVARMVLQALPLERRQCLLDVGGGDGTFLRSVAAAVPGLHLKLWDLPPVVSLARQRMQEAGLSARVDCVPGNFHSDPVPPGADVITLLRVLHDHDDQPALALLKRLQLALPDKGVLVLAEPMADAPGAARMGAAYFGLYLWAMRSGRPRSLSENKALLQEAGFRQIQSPVSHLPLQAQILIASKTT